MTRLDGIDGSHYQWDAGPVDVHAVRFIPTWWFAWKATQSLKGVDQTLDKTMKASIAQGFTHILSYHWLSSTTDVIGQANHYLDVAWQYRRGAMLDAEEAGITEPGCLAWCERVEDTTHRPTSVYTGLYVAGGSIWRSKRLRMSKYGPRPMHVAAYVTEVNLNTRMQGLGFIPDYPWHAWQFSSNGPVNGIVGRCDMNRVDARNMYDAVCGITTSPMPIPQGEHDMRVYGCIDVGRGYGDIAWPTGGCSLYTIMPNGALRALGWGEWHVEFKEDFGEGVEANWLDLLGKYVEPGGSAPAPPAPPATSYNIVTTSTINPV